MSLDSATIFNEDGYSGAWQVVPPENVHLVIKK